MSLCKHLGAYQHVEIAFCKVQKDPFKFVPARFCISIDAADPQTGKTLAQDFFDLLSAFAYVVDMFAAAHRTLRRRALTMITIMADQREVGTMIGQRDIAVRTHDRFAA